MLVFLWSMSGANAGLLAHYSFDSDFSDTSGNDNHLTVAAGSPGIASVASEVALGSGALDVESTTSTEEYLSLTTPLSFAASDAWSVAFWAQHRPGNDGRAGMIVGDLTSTSFIWIPRDGAVDGLRFRNSANQNADYATPPAGVEPAGVYHHWAVVANGAGSVEVFYDNVSLGSTSIATTFEITSVAQAFNQTTQSMNGQIDELYIFDEAIDASRINELSSGSSEPDTTPPTLNGADIVDNQGGGPVGVHAPVIYMVSFSEDMDAVTVDASDFGNAGTAPIDIGPITESAPGAFSVTATPTGIGTLQFQVVAGAELTDASGNALDTTAAIADDTVIAVEEDTTPPSPASRLRVYLIGGQSNADGRGDPAGLPTTPVNLQLPQEDVDYYYGSTLTTLRPLSEFGPEVTLGRRLADSFKPEVGTRVAIIKYGVGGTSLKTDWKGSGDDSTSGDGPRYITFQQTVSNGLAALAVAYPEAEIGIEGMLWVQGERDARNLDHAEYGPNLRAFVADVRATYGTGLPFVVMRLSSGQTNLPAEGLEGVRNAQTLVAASHPRTALIDSDGFSLKSDALHFDATGQQQIGNASAGAFLAFVPINTTPTLHRIENGGLEVTIDGVFPDLLYTLQTSTTLEPGLWEDAGSVIASGPQVLFSFTPVPGDPRRFFRVKSSPAP